MQINQTVQAEFLEKLCTQKIKAAIYLVNGIRLETYIQSFDEFTIELKGTVNTILYKHAICSIVPLNTLGKVKP